MNNREVFVETSVMTDYLIKEKARQERVEQVLAGFNRKLTSNYVRMEFKKGALTHLIYLYNKIVICQNIIEVFQAIDRLSCTPQKNKLSTVLELVANFFSTIYKTKPAEIIKECGNITLDEFAREKAIAYFGSVIRRSWKDFDKVVDEIINPMQCFVDIQAPYKEGRIYKNVPSNCKQSKNGCKIKEFFKENKQNFQSILAELDRIRITLPDTETTKRIRSLKEILRLIELNREIKVQDCWYCSDAIIVVEAPNSASIFNNNKKHYAPICNAVGKKSIGYNA